MAGRNWRNFSVVGRSTPDSTPQPVAFSQPGALIPNNALVASAVRYPGKAARIYMPSQQWQQEAYRHYSICGEARYAANYFGHSLSKVNLYTATPTGSELVKAADDATSSQALRALFNGAEGQAQMLTSLGVHLTVAGDCYLVGRSLKEGERPETGVIADPFEEHDETDPPDVWEVVSIQEMHVLGNKWTIKYGSGMNDVELDEDAVVIRIWRPHPARRIEADSPFRSLLPVLNEIEWLTKHIFAQCQSRLTGAGILFMPQEMSFPPPPDVDGKAQQMMNDAELFTLTIGEAMLGTIENPELASSVVPTVVTAPGESIDKAKLMHFWSNLDEKALEMRAAAVGRFADGMDLPREKLLGMSSGDSSGGGKSSGVNHWGMWQVDEDAITLHIEPMCELIVNAVTIGYLRQADEGGSDVVRYDTSSLRLRPDRSAEAMELWDRIALSTEAMLREVGFSVKDAPDEEERKERILLKIASGSATPDQVSAAAKFFGVDIPTGDILGLGQEPRETRPDPSLEDHPSRDIPEEPTPDFPQAAALLAACDALVYRALERAGNRLRQTVSVAPTVPSFKTHTMIRANGTASKVLDDAFSCAPQVLEGIADPTKVIPVLESYCHTLIAEQSPHERARLEAWLGSQL